ncbi:MAG: imidazole glycerol phosphate synthase subunit HisH [Spirochaetes bacterium]|nr:imidazole glycerol phosphate synthase subunit HisH [Spirochaetota bacterium]
MSSRKAVIINYQMGNLSSVYNAFKFLGIDVEITDSKQKIMDSSGIILPGVGAFGDTMKNLDTAGVIDTIKNEITKGKPYLGICLGYQVLFEKSEEDEGIEGLNLLKGKVIRFKTKSKKIPHIGWNQIRKRKESSLIENIPDESFFYFVHSYYPVPEDDNIILTETEYDEIFASSIAVDNIFATQFHPEKSQENGLQIIKSFGEFCDNNSGN